MAAAKLTAEVLDVLYEFLLRADPRTDKPPFFDKLTHPARGKIWYWRLARVSPPCRPFYEWKYTPRTDPVVVFKEVGSETARGFIELTSIPIVYLVRHPCATVASLVVGQRAKKTPDGRARVASSLIRKHDAELYDRVKGRFPRMDWYERNALVWRTDVERVVRAMQQCKRGRIMTYEQLCDDAMAQAYQVCNQFGLRLHPNMRDFLNKLYHLGQTTEHRSADVRDSHFTVFRNPSRQRDAWKRKLPAETQKKILSLVSDSEAVQLCAQFGNWDL